MNQSKIKLRSRFKEAKHQTHNVSKTITEKDSSIKVLEMEIKDQATYKIIIEEKL